MPWGKTRYATGDPGTARRYTGQSLEPDLGLYYYGARWYDPQLGRFISPDTVIPSSFQRIISWDRYAYTFNNPIIYSDPSGHWPEWFDTIGEFSQGMLFEFARTNNWAGAIVSPDAAEALAPSVNESDAMLMGRMAGDVLTVSVGLVELSGGITFAGGGAAVGCGTTLCIASAPAVATGVAVSAYGVATSLSGAAALGDNLGRVYANRHKNDLNPDPNAEGPHSTYKRDPVTGKITNYETYQPNPNNPNGWDIINRYDGVGKGHIDPDTGEKILPHFHEYPGGHVRPPRPDEIP